LSHTIEPSPRAYLHTRSCTSARAAHRSNRIYLPLSTCLSSLFGALAASAGLAQSATTQPAPTPVEEVLITERSLEQTLPLELARYGADLEIITGQVINRHGFVDVAQALEMLVPGLHLTTQAGAFSYVNMQMQGSRPSDVLWTVDGIRINNRLYNSTSPADTLPSAMIERTEVLKGGYGVMYGTQAIAGVVNVVTRGFSDTTDGSLTVGAGSHGAYRANGYLRGAVGDHKLVGWLSRDASDGYEIYDAYQPNAVHRKRGYNVASAGLKYGFDFSPALSLSLTGIHTDARLDYPNVSNVSVNDRTEDIFSAKLDYLPSERARFYTKAYYHAWDTDYYTPPNPSAYWGYRDKGISAAMAIADDRWFEYHLGYDFQTYQGQDQVLLIAGQQENVHALFAQIRSQDTLSQRARFAAGVRYNNTGGTDSTVWNVSGVYDITDSLFVQGMAATSFMLPSAENLYRIHCPTGTNCTHGNPNLAPEQSQALNLSVGGQFSLGQRTLEWQLSGWDRTVDNLITTAPIPVELLGAFPAGFTRTFVNIADKTDVTGSELLLRGPFSDALSFDVSYTYSKELARGTRTQIMDRPRRQYRGSLSYQSTRWPVGANIAVKYIGEKTANVTGFGLRAYGESHVVDAGIHAYLDPARAHRVSLRLENLFDETYATAVNSAVLAGSANQRFLWQRLAPPRTVHLNYSYRF
jgi:outer membrane cobalamin receptor